MFAYYNSLIEQECKQLGYKTERKTASRFSCNGVEFLKTTASPASARQICRNKVQTHKYVTEVGLHVPNHYIIHKGEKIEQKLPFPLVVKPVDSSLGNMVYVNITDEENFLKRADEVIQRRGKVLVEEYISGKKYRVFSTNKKTVSVIEYEPSEVVGDGKSSIRSLVRTFNMKKVSANKKFPKAKFPVLNIMNGVLEAQGYKQISVPPKGARILVNNLSTRAAGSHSKEILTEENRSFFDFCHLAVDSVPMLKTTGVDIIIEDETGRKIVLEMNGTPHLRANLWPLEGHPQPVIRELVNAYFPNGEA